MISEHSQYVSLGIIDDHDDDPSICCVLIASTFIVLLFAGMILYGPLIL